MAHIVLEPRGPLELGILGDEYERLVQDLEAQGHRVTLRPAAEYRSRDAVIQGAYVVAVYLAENVTEEVLGAIVYAVGHRLVARYRPKHRRRAGIYAADGRTVLREVDLPDKPDDPD